MTKRFRFITSDEILVGVVQGAGGPVPSLRAIHKEQQKAVEGLRLGVFEPKTGHVAVFCEFSAESNGPRSLVDLRNPTLRILECA